MFYSVRRLKEKWKIARGETDVHYAGAGDPKKKAVYEIVVQLVLTFAIGGFAVFVLLNDYGESAQKLAAGWFGAVVGYWFR